MGWFLNIDRLAVDKHLAAGDAGAAKQSFHQLAAPCPYQSEQANDFTAAHRQAYRGAYARGFYLFEAQQFAAVLTRFPVIDITQIAPYHRLHQQVVVDLLHVAEGADIATIFKHGNSVAEGEDLLHTVRHVQNDAPLFAQLADHPEQVLDFTCRQGAGGFVKGDNFGITRQRFGNLHHLPLADGEILERGLGINIQPKVLKL